VDDISAIRVKVAKSCLDCINYAAVNVVRVTATASEAQDFETRRVVVEMLRSGISLMKRMKIRRIYDVEHASGAGAMG
jgi:hypothetical protein